MSDLLETGDLFFFYRSVVDVDRARNLDDIQHLYLVLVPDDDSGNGSGNRDHARVLVVGRKRLPEADAGRDESTGRGWLMTLASGPSAKLAERFAPLAYETRTEGSRRQPEAIPAGSARYAIQLFEDESYLIYRLARPEEPGAAQRTLGIESQAGLVLAARNPDVDVEGFPDEKPDYPEELAGMFEDLRWMEIRDPRLLDYEHAQFVLISAFTEVDTTGLDLSGEPDLFGTLELDRSDWATGALEDGEFPEARYPVPSIEPVGDRSAAGRRGGRAALEAPSAAGIAKALEGIDFPRDREGLVTHADGNDADPDILETLRDLPDRRFRDMAEVEKALGEVR